VRETGRGRVRGLGERIFANMGLAQAVSGPGYSDRLRARRSGDRTPVGPRFFTHV
jgi:hypothetical protein